LENSEKGVCEYVNPVAHGGFFSISPDGLKEFRKRIRKWLLHRNAKRLHRKVKRSLVEAGARILEELHGTSESVEWVIRIEYPYYLDGVLEVVKHRHLEDVVLLVIRAGVTDDGMPRDVAGGAHPGLDHEVISKMMDVALLRDLTVHPVLDDEGRVIRLDFLKVLPTKEARGDAMAEAIKTLAQCSIFLVGLLKHHFIKKHRQKHRRLIKESRHTGKNVNYALQRENELYRLYC